MEIEKKQINGLTMNNYFCLFISLTVATDSKTNM